MPVVDTLNSYEIDFEQLAQARTGEPGWLTGLRRDAFARFAAQGFPTTRQEEWRFTNVAPIAESQFRVAADVALRSEQMARHSWASAGMDEIVIVNGRFAPQLSAIGSLPRGVILGGLADVNRPDGGRAAQATGPLVADHLGRLGAYEAQPFVALNTAFWQDGGFVYVPSNVVLDRPIHVLFVSAGPSARVVSHPRLLVIAASNSQLRFVETYAHAGGAADGGLGTRFTNAVTEILLQDGAVVDHYRVQREPREAYHVATTAVRLGRSSTFSSNAFTFGGGIVRQDVNVTLADEGGDCTLDGLYLGDGTRLVDNHTFIDHAMPHCTSHELYKGILAGRAHAVFNGKILVRPDAQKTDAKQTNKTLLLSDDAQINTKPQLEIYANDVKCTHGATIGQLSADALFYLQARGIGREEARRMLIRAFAGDITSRVRIGALRDALDAWLLEALEGR